MSVSRRHFLATGMASAAALQLAPRTFAQSSPDCSLLMPEQEVGPFYLGDEMIRSTIAEDRPGIPLRVRLLLVDHTTCAPISNAAIDVWHCDALGLYSGFTKSKGFGPPPGGGGPGGPGGPPPFGDRGGPGGPPPPSRTTDKLTFLRGIQLTGPDGSVEFQTIFPGFYEGRTNHIHFKVRLDGRRSGGTYAAGHTSHTGQLFFPEDLNLKLMSQGPYADHHIHRTTTAEDHVYNGQQGSASLAKIQKENSGFSAELRVSVDPKLTPAAVSMFGPPR